MKKVARILVIEDEPGVALALYRSLSRDSYQVSTAKTGLSGLRKTRREHFDLVLLDLGLPDTSGLQICRQMRSEGFMEPIIILTGDGTVRSKVALLDAGATDYLTKPFSLQELLARIRASLRRQPAPPVPVSLAVEGLTLSAISLSANRDGISIPLRRKEFAILEYLMKHAGEVVSRNRLSQHVWGENNAAWTNTIDVHIKHLRDKVDRPFGRPMIKTVHGLGYKLETSKLVAK